MKNLDIMFNLLSYEGSASNDPSDAIKVKNKTQDTTITEVSRQQLQIADNATDVPVGLPNVACDFLAILIDRNVSVKLNGWTTDLALKARANGTKTLALFTRGDISGLTISNASGATANVDIILVNK